MNKEQQKLAQQIIAALKDIDLPFNTDIYISIAGSIDIKVYDHIYGE